MGMLNGLLALVSLAVAAWSFYTYTKNAGTVYIVVAIVFGILMIVFGGLFLSGRINKSEDIHITE